MAEDEDTYFMRQAIAVATEKGDDPSVSSIGCVVVLDGEVIAAERNHVDEH